MVNPNLVDAETISEEDFKAREGEVLNIGQRQFKVKSDKADYIAPEGDKSKNLYQGSDKGYFDIIASNKKYYNEDGSPMSAQEINMLTGTRKIGESKLEDYNEYVGYKPKQIIVTFKKDTENREFTDDSTRDIPEKKKEEKEVIIGDNITYTATEKDNKKGTNKPDQNKIPEDQARRKCKTNDTSCVAPTGDQSKKALKAAQKKRKLEEKLSKKRDRQIERGVFAPGEWFSQKMDDFKTQRIKNQAKRDQKQRQKEIDKESKRRSKRSQVEFQHKHSDRYGKIDNFFNELAYKRINKPGKSRRIKANF